MSAFPFARDMKVCDSKGAIQTTLLVDNYTVSAGLRVGLMPVAQGSWELLCTFFPAVSHQLTAYCRNGSSVPPQPCAICVSNIAQHICLRQLSCMWQKDHFSRPEGLILQAPLQCCALCDPMLCSPCCLGGEVHDEPEMARKGEERRMGMVVGETRVWLRSSTGCLLLGDAGPAPLLLPPSAHFCHSLVLVVLYRRWAGLAFWSHRRLTQQKEAGNLDCWGELTYSRVRWALDLVARCRGKEEQGLGGLEEGMVGTTCHT